jgi:hypothetical protein
MYSLDAVDSAADRSARLTFDFAASAAVLKTLCAVWPTSVAPLFATFAAASPIEDAFGLEERFADPVLAVAALGLFRADAARRGFRWLGFRPFGSRFAVMMVLRLCRLWWLTAALITIDI